MSVPVFKKSYAPKAAEPAPRRVFPDETTVDLPVFSKERMPPSAPKELTFAKSFKPAKGGTRRRRGGDLGKLLNPLIGKPKPKAALVIRDPNGPSPAKPSINGGRSNKKKTHRRRR